MDWAAWDFVGRMIRVVCGGADLDLSGRFGGALDGWLVIGVGHKPGCGLVALNDTGG